MIIELLCTFTGVLAGIAIVASLVRHQDASARFKAAEKSVDAERIQGIAQQLQKLSSKVAANVSAHSENIGKFSGQLSEPDSPVPEEILATINEIVAANQAMQGQLADAKERIDQQTQMIETASKQARTDALTGLSNRRALDEFLANSIKTASPQTYVGLMLLDIDHFKNFNDSFGHTTGDAVLASFARAIDDKCDIDAYPARFGGEEFAVVLTSDSQDKMVEQAASIRHHVSEQVISYEDLQLKITASGGLCLLAKDDDIQSAYERADEGLYKSKKAGRNCGFWLNESQWDPFPVPGEDEEDLLADAGAETQVSELPSQVATPNPKADSAAESVAQFDSEDAPESEAMASFDEEETSEADEGNLEILDLASFLTRVDEKIEHLRRGDLDATAIMVEATGLQDADAAEAATSWEHTVALIQVNLRGIDVVCQFRPFTLCIFIPGSAQEAALDRAATLQHSLPQAKGDWPDVVCPERLAISIAQVDGDEKSSVFLDRLEMALDEALNNTEGEVAIHTGEECQFQAI